MSTNYNKIVCVDNYNDYLSVYEHIENNDLILTLDQDVFELCKEHSLKCVDLEKILNSNELDNKYGLFTNLIIQINESIKICFRKYFSDEDMGEVFDWFFYPLKITIDQTLFYKIIIDRAISFYSVEKIVVRKDVKLKLDNDLLIDSNVSMLSFVARDVVSNYHGKIVETYVSKHSKSISSDFSFGQIKGVLYNSSKEWKKSVTLLIKYIKFILSILRYKLFMTSKKYYYLSIGCKEIDILSSVIEETEVKVIALNFNDYLRIDYDKANELSSKYLIGDFSYEGFDLQKYIIQLTGVLALNANKLYLRKRIISSILRYIQPKCVFVQTLSSFNINSMIINSIAKDISVDVYCWMHGGYGAYSSLAGYDVTDFKHSRNHIVYGNGAKNTIMSDESILRSLYPKVQYKTLVLGSPYLDNLYLEQKQGAKLKKKIVFSLQGIYNHNQYYFGYFRPYGYLNFWNECKNIISTLSLYSKEFDIYIKDYPISTQKDRVNRLLKRLKDDNIIYLSDHCSYKDTIQDADTLIYPWVSTSFIEALYTNADILLYDNSKITNEAYDILICCNVFSKDLNVFVKKMVHYLDNLSLSTNNAINSHESRATLKKYFIQSINNKLRVKKIMESCN